MIVNTHFHRKKRDQLRSPTSVEKQHQHHGKEQSGSDDFRKAMALTEELTPHSSESPLFPTISHGVCSPTAKKDQQKPADDSGLLYPLLTVQPPRRTFWDNIGNRHNQQLLAPWPRGEDTSADILIKMLETPRANRMLENKWPCWEDHREATKQQTTSAKQCHLKSYLGHHKLPWSSEGTWPHDSKHRGQDMLSSIYYKYIYKGGNDEWAETYRDSMQHSDTGYENQSSYEESPVRRTNMCNFDIKYGKKMSKGKDMPLSKQESSFVIKLQTPPDLYRANKYKRHESPFLKNSHLRTLGTEETDPNEVELQGENAAKPKQSYEPTDWKYLISKDDTTLSTLDKMFMKKGWGYECSSPTSKMFRDYYWIMDSDDDDTDDEEEEEEEKSKEQQTEKK